MSRLARLRRRIARSGGGTIPLAHAASFQRESRRTLVLFAVLTVAALALLLGAFLAAPHPETRRFRPPSTVGIVVLDISSSVKPKTYRLIVEQLRSFSRSGRRFGVVLFSDTAYEALPPGTPAVELRRLVRFFEPHPVTYGPDGSSLPLTPWEQTFTGGTVISAGMRLAAELLERPNVVRGDVVLISDLVNDPSDYGALRDVMSLYAERSIPLRLVPLDPPAEYFELFRDLIREKNVVTDAKLPDEVAGRGELTVAGTFPTGLLIFSLLLAVALGGHLTRLRPLTWRRA